MSGFTSDHVHQSSWQIVCESVGYMVTILLVHLQSNTLIQICITFNKTYINTLKNEKRIYVTTLACKKIRIK